MWKNNKNAAENILNPYKTNVERNLLMVTRITCEFECPEFAETALRQIRETVNGVYSAKYFYRKSGDRAQERTGSTMFTIMPTGLTSQNYLTAVMESPFCRDTIPEPARSRKTNVFIVCDGSGSERISSVLTSMGAENIHSGS